MTTQADRISNPQGFHQPTAQEALTAYADSLPGTYHLVAAGIKKLVNYYPAKAPEARVPDAKPQEFQHRINVEAKEGRVHVHLPKGVVAYVEPDIARDLAGHLISHSYVAEGKSAPDQVTIRFVNEDEQP